MLFTICCGQPIKNRERGIFMKYPSLSGEELERKVGSGHCLVAIQNGHVIGTCSFKVVKRNEWYAKKQNIAYYLMEGVLPQWQGKGVYGKLMKDRESLVKKKRINIVEMDTAENNKEIQRILLKHDYKYVKLRSFYSNHYSVVMVKWLDGCPYRNLYCQIRFIMSKWKIKLKYKPGHIKRFFIF